MSEKRSANRNPVMADKFNDMYVLGIFAQKTSTVQYFIKKKARLRRIGMELDLFNKGIAEASSYGFEDIAYDMKIGRDAAPEMFDNFIKMNAGHHVLNEVLASIKNAHDWETEELRAAGREVIYDMNRPDSRMNKWKEVDCEE